MSAMHNKYQKKSSIEISIKNESQADIIQTQKQYIANLQSENKYKTSALITAESLILNYQVQNKLLKQKNQEMQVQIIKLSHKLELLQNLLVKQQTKNVSVRSNSTKQQQRQKRSEALTHSPRNMQQNIDTMQIKMEKLLLKQQIYQSDIKSLKRQIKNIGKNQKDHKFPYDEPIDYLIPLDKLQKRQSHIKNTNKSSQNQYLKMVLKLDRKKRIKTVTQNYTTPNKKQNHNNTFWKH